MKLSQYDVSINVDRVDLSNFTIKPEAEMAEMESVADFLYQHMRAHLDDKDLMRIVKAYRGHIPMYHHLSQISQGLYDTIRKKEEVGDVWREAAKIALWVARIADLYEKEADRTVSSVSPS